MSVGHLLKSGEDVDKRYHEINVVSSKESDVNNVLEIIQKSNPTISTVSHGSNFEASRNAPHILQIS